MIIDAHAHIYPEKIAEKAALSIGDYYEIKMRHNGTFEGLLAQGDKAGIDKFVVHSVATTPRQVSAINQFVAQSVKAHPDRFIGFCTLHPDCESIPALVDEALALGLVGMKLHADFQKFNLDSPAAMRMYETIEGRMPLLVHAGDYRTSYTKPHRIVNIKRAFPKLDIIAAHFGGYSEWGSCMREMADLGIYIDTCSSLPFIRPMFARMILDTFGADHALFGTDYPMWDAAEERARFEEVPMSSKEREMVYHENFERLMAPYLK